MPKTKSSTKAKATKPAAKKTAAAKTTAKAPAVRTTVTRSSAASSRSYKEIFTNRISSELSLGALFAELVSSFAIVALLLSTNGNAIVAGVAVLVLTVVFGKISGAHVNPIVSIALVATRKVSVVRGIGYIVAQLLGAMLALVVISQFVSATPPSLNPYTGEAVPPEVFKVADLAGQWRPFFAEALGAVVVGLSIAAISFQRREGLEAGFVAGGALMLGLLLATQGSAAILNPAAALSLNAYRGAEDLIGWAIAAYAVAPIIGAIAGAWIFRALQWDSKSKLNELS